MLKKILFPFFNKNRHSFLTKKARFRFLMSIYIVALIFIPVRTAFIEYSNTADMCYDYVYEYNYYEEYSECMKNYDILGTALLYL